MSQAVCTACSHKIDAAAKLCPYCGENPENGEKVDAQALHEHIHRHHSRSSAQVLEFARTRQGIVIAAGAIVTLLFLGALHQYVTMRNARAVSSEPAVPLTDITDLSNQGTRALQPPMPDLKYQYAGDPRAMRTCIVEPGAVTPPEVIAAQRAAAPKAGQAQPSQPAGRLAPNTPNTQKAQPQAPEPPQRSH